MRLKVVALAALVFVLGLLAWRSRPARVLSGAVTSVTGSNPPVAHLSLEHSRGRRAASMIVDVLDGEGATLGSQTVSGGRALLEVPLHRTAPQYRVRVTNYQRLPSGVRRMTAELWAPQRLSRSRTAFGRRQARRKAAPPVPPT
jgi:hypothetical protein